MATLTATSGGRLDQVLPTLGLARSRSQAAELIHGERVRINGVTITRPAHRVSVGAVIDVDVDPWVSRAAYKLLGALDQSGLQVPARVLDAGASTGGFTQVLLTRGARTVFAVDVGHDQLAGVLRSDPRVVVREGLNLRDLTLDDLDGVRVNMVVADVSFISLRMILPPVLSVVDPDGVALLMIKPQFEVGRRRLGAGGVVRDSVDRRAAIDAVLHDARQLGWSAIWQADSTLPGPSGNLEHFVALRFRDGSGESTEALGCRP